MTQVIEDDQSVQLKRIHGASRNPNLSIKMTSSGPSRSQSQFGSKATDRVATSRTIIINPS